MFSFLKKKRTLVSPFDGSWLDLEQVPDEVFSKRLLGDGFAIVPESGLLLSPIKGKIIQIFPTHHALGILSDDGIEILIHIGIDTVELKGQGFKPLVEVNQEVEQGMPLIQIDIQKIKEMGKSLISPLIFTNGEKIIGVKLLQRHGIAGKTEVIEITLK